MIRKFKFNNQHYPDTPSDLQVEYTIQLQVEGKTYLAASNTKKAAKQACASEAWNAIRATLL